MTTNDPTSTDPTSTGPTSTDPTVPVPTTDPTPNDPTPAPGDGPWLRGPAPFAIVLGLLGLLVAGGTLLNELTDVSLPWADLGPWTVVAAGLVVVLVGAIGLRSSRRAQA